MDGITLSFTDARPVLAPGALEEQVRAAAPLLAEAAAGEERYRDNLGSVSYTHLTLPTILRV